MDYLDEYLSLVQSLKSHSAPKMDLRLKVQQRLEPITADINETPPPSTVPKIPIVKKSEPEITNPSRYPLNLPNIPPVLDNPFHTTIKKALPREVFYQYLPIGISPAKKLPSCDLPRVPIFFYGENNFDRNFLTNIIAAIQDKFALSSTFLNVQEIEECNLWRSVVSMSHLRCVIVYDTWITTCPHGRCWYRAQPNTNNCFLGTIPLIVLSSEADWYRDINNKKVLWNQLCRILKKPSHKTTIK